MSQQIESQQIESQQIESQQIESQQIESQQIESQQIERESARTPVFMWVDTPLGGMWATDLGMGGMRCLTRQVMCAGHFFDVSFRLPAEDRVLKVGAQVTRVGAGEGGDLVVHVRFCRPSRKVSMALFQFLDRRRTLWDEEQALHPARRVPGADPRPFAGLLMDAWSTLQKNEEEELRLIDPSRELRTLSKILGRPPVGEGDDLPRAA